jgi:hypothetical protein
MKGRLVAKIQGVELRLTAWADWVATGGRGSSGMLSMFNGEPGDGDVAYNIPFNEEECWRTDASIKQLDEAGQLLIGLHYLVSPNVAKQRLCISTTVLSQRLDKIHRQLWLMWEPKTVSANSLPTGF